jgi:hypothetical protein
LPARDGHTRTETYVGFGLLLVLAAIAVGVFLKQFHYNPAIFVGSGIASIQTEAGFSRDFLVQVAEGMVPLSPPEIFGPENLSDKIDGKAELYLSAGFLGLLCQRFAKKEDPRSWMEAFVYDMGTVRSAFAVYSVQRRADAANVALTDFAYETENALFFVQGRYYVELIAAVTSERMAEAMRSFGHRFIGKAQVRGERIGELSLFPREGLAEHSIRLLISDAFGFDRFDNVFTANYTLEDTELMAFLSQRGDSSEASELLAAYHTFLIANGGADVKSDRGIPEAKLVNIFDTFEVIFSHGKFLGGVHGAEDRGKAEKLAVRLRQKLSGAGS